MTQVQLLMLHRISDFLINKHRQSHVELQVFVAAAS